MASIDLILYQLDSIGVFDYLLPFLLVFALTFGILSVTRIAGDQKGIHAVIAIVIGLMAIRLGFTQSFFAEIFPRLGIGMAILLSIMLLVGLFVPKDEMRFWGWGLATIGLIIAIIIVTQSFDRLGYVGLAGWEDYVGYIIGAVLLIGVIIAVVAGNNSGNPPRGPAEFGPWRR